MTNKIAILQSNYIPWKGYFDLMNMVDEFVVFDEAQFTKGDWRNRNLIKTPQGLQWLTIPVEKTGATSKKISEVRVADPAWGRKHWASIRQNYSRAAHFHELQEIFQPLFEPSGIRRLSEINLDFVDAIVGFLGIETKIRQSSEFELLPGRTERLLHICRQCDASEYVSGPGAQAYFDMELADAEGIRVTWMDYAGYPEYAQLHPPFEHGVTILDLLFNEGPKATRFMKSFRNA